MHSLPLISSVNNNTFIPPVRDENLKERMFTLMPLNGNLPLYFAIGTSARLIVLLFPTLRSRRSCRPSTALAPSFNSSV